MANVSLCGFSGLQILPVWPFSSGEGLPAFPSWTQPALDHLEQRGLPALQRTKPSRRVVDFSIRSILPLEGPEGEKETQEERPEGAVEWGGTPQGYSWIRCTRFKPPAVPRSSSLLLCTPDIAFSNTRRVVDFSIQSILALESSEGEKETQEEPPEGAVEWGGTPQGYSWIRCTRFKPPAIPKMKRAGGSRLPSRSPRIPFSATQLGTLERSFQQARYLSTGQVRNVALLLGLTENRVKIWFQNRRARERRDFLKRQPSRTVGVKGGHLQDQPPSGWC